VTLTHLPPDDKYPGLTRATIDGRTFVMTGIWTRPQVLEALRGRMR
jgi:hypothetical protein